MSTLKTNTREEAICEWALKFETNVLLKPEHTHLRPAATTQDLVDVETALGSEYEMKPFSECASVFLRHLKSLYTRYPSERGERTVLKCLNSAVMKRFMKGGDAGMPGLVLADLFVAERLAAEVMRCSGSVEPPVGQYQLSLPVGDMSWARRIKFMEEDKPEWPNKDHFATFELYDEAMGLAEQEWWESWANEIEKAWGCYVYDAIPIHLREAIVRKDMDKQRFLDYDGYDGRNFDCGGRQVDDYKGPMDWMVDFTFYLMILSQMFVGKHQFGMELMTQEVKRRLQKKKGVRMAWVTLVDLKKIINKFLRQLDQAIMEE